MKLKSLVAMVAFWVMGAQAQDLSMINRNGFDQVPTSTTCINLIKPVSGGYQIFYGNGTTSPVFASGTFIGITDSGFYELCGDVQGSYPQNQIAIFIQTSNVVLDLAGFSIINTGGSALNFGIQVPSSSFAKNIVIKNGRVAKFFIDVYVTGASDVTIQDVQVYDNTNNGYGFSLTGNDITLERCHAANCNIGYFIDSPFSGALIGCTAFNNNGGFGLLANAEQIIKDCTALGNNYGFFSAGDALFIGNLATQNSTANYDMSATQPFDQIVIANGAQLPIGKKINKLNNIEID